MSKEDFKVIRKESINIDEWVKKHPKYNAAIELDPQKPGYGWIVFHTQQQIEKLATFNLIVRERCWHYENVIIVKAKIQRITNRHKMDVKKALENTSNTDSRG